MPLKGLELDVKFSAQSRWALEKFLAIEIQA